MQNCRFVRVGKGGVRAADRSTTERWRSPAGRKRPPPHALEKTRGTRYGASGSFAYMAQQVLRCRVTDRWARSDLFAVLESPAYSELGEFDYFDI